MQIESMKVFRDLAETESFTRAAQMNDITQSAVSQQISSLEKHFKSLLIERSKKKFRLTREGQVLHEFCKQIVQAYDTLNSRLLEIKDVVSGTIRISAIYSIGLHDLPPYIKQFLKLHSTVNVHVEYRRANQVYEDVMGQSADIGLVAYPSKDPKIEVIPWKEDPMVLICHPQHRFAASERIALSSLARERFIAFETDIPTRKEIDKVFRENGLEVNNTMEFDNIETVKRAVEIDAGISIVPKSTVSQEVQKGSVRCLDIEGFQFRRPLAVIHKKSKVLSPAMHQFLEVLKSNEGVT